jgi:hypothetical protein
MCVIGSLVLHVQRGEVPDQAWLSARALPVPIVPQAFPQVKRRESWTPFVTPTLPAPGLLTRRPKLLLDRRRSSHPNDKLSA